MPAALILEDGTGKIDSNTYQLLSDFRTYFDNIEVDTSDLTDDMVTAALYETGKNLMEWCYEYKGYISFPETPQSLSWPRTGLRDRKGLEIPSDSIPDDIKAAQNELARSVALETFNGERLAYSDEPTNTGAEKRNKLDVMEEEFYGPGTALQLTVSKTAMSYVKKILSPYIKGGNPFQIRNVAVV